MLRVSFWRSYLFLLLLRVWLALELKSKEACEDVLFYSMLAFIEFSFEPKLCYGWRKQEGST